MAKLTKKMKEMTSKIDRDKKYPLNEAFDILMAGKSAKFDESVDFAFRLGVDPKQSDQQVRGAVALPNGLGKDVRVLVFAKGPKEAEAKEAGADFVGADDLVEKIKGGWLDFDKVLATPDMMVTVSKVAKILGPRSLMPNPKVGTVTMNIGAAVESEKKGKLSFRVEKNGIVHASIGRKSMGGDKLKENFGALMSTLMKAKPSSSKGVYLKTVAVSTTMGAGIKIDPADAQTVVN
jgi:large subunit ribosomal protein L1